MLVALVSKSKVDAGAVLSSGPHQVGHDAGDVERQFAFDFCDISMNLTSFLCWIWGLILALTRSDPS